MKSFDQFKTIAYKNAIPHTVYKDGRSEKIGKGKAIAVRSRSSARGGHGGGHGDHGGHGGAAGAAGDGGAGGGDGGDGD
jgi:hypothetical protein